MAEFDILGPVRVRVQGRLIDLGAPKVRGLLGILLLSANVPVSTGQILDSLWDRLPGNPVKTLHLYISRLRAVVERSTPARIITEHRSYRIDVDPSTIDYHRFRELAEKGIEDSRRGDHSRAVLELSAAVELWRDRPLADLESSWARWHGERLETTDLGRARRHLFEAHLELGHDEYILSNLDPLRTGAEPDEALMEIYLRAVGRRDGPASVDRHFTAFADRIREALGAEPGERLVRLRRRLLDRAASDRPVAGMPRTVPQLLPRDVPHFVGRAEPLRRLDALLDPNAEQPAVVCVDGAPGVGKTALTVRWAHARRDRFPDGILYADLNGYGRGGPLDPAAVLTTFLTAVGIPHTSVRGDVPANGALLRQMLAGRRTLVVLDNARDAAQVRPLLAPTSPCPVLITSREHLGQTGTHGITVPALLSDETTAVLQHKIGADRAVGDLAATHDLAVLCGGLPLILQVIGDYAAARPDVPLHDVVELMRDHRRLLDAGGEGDDGSRSPRAAFDMSCSGLPGEVDRMYQLIGLHPTTTITTQAAAALAGVPVRDAERALDRLVGAHLVQQLGVDSFRMHDLLHLHAGDRAEAGQPPISRREAVVRMTEWYLLAITAAIERLSPQRKPVPPLPHVSDVPTTTFGSDLEALAWCRRERQQIMAVTYRAAASGLHDHVWRLVGTFADQLNRYGDPREAIEVHLAALNSARVAGARDGEAGNQNNVGVMYFLLGQQEAAAQHFSEALTLFRELDDERGEAQALHNLGNIYLERHLLRRALEFHERSLAVTVRIGDQMGEARAYHRLGDVHRQLEQPDVAREYLSRALRIRTQLHDARGRGATLRLLAELHREAGELPEAVALTEEAVTLCRETYDQRQLSAALRTLSAAHCQLGAHEAAAACAEEAARLSHYMGDEPGERQALDLLAQAHHLTEAHLPEPRSVAAPTRREATKP